MTYQQPWRLFTLEEAKEALVAIEPLAREAQQKVGELQSLRLNQGRAFQETQHTNGHHTNGHHAEAEENATGQGERAERLLNDIQELINQIQAHGCELKDPTLGLLDFRAMRDDRIVYLCWKLGEDTIAYWHELETGYAGRQPL